MTELQHDQWQRERLLEALDAYRRGISDAPVLRKWSKVEGDAASDLQTRKQGQAMAFVISTDEVDRHGDIIDAAGWDLGAYLKNPVFLWAHDYARPVIGKAMDVWKELHSLMAKFRFAPTEFAQEVAALYETGYQSGVSVGFKPLKYEERRQEKTGAFLGIRFLEQELLEVSAVPVPANRSALRRALELSPKLKGYLGAFDGPDVPGPGDRSDPGYRSDPGDRSSPDLTPRRDNGAGLEWAWPRISAQVDELGKLTGEPAGMISDIGKGVDLSRTRDLYASEVDQVLSALRQASAELRVKKNS